jgi:hypothetical protein
MGTSFLEPGTDRRPDKQVEGKHIVVWIRSVFWRGPNLRGWRDAMGRPFPWREKTLWSDELRRNRGKWSSRDAVPEGGTSLGIALSGGGSRAAAFAIGALLYVVDSGLNKFVTAITSVSGGSIPNAAAAHFGDFRTATPEGIRECLIPVAQSLAQGIVPRRVVRLYVGLIYLALTTSALVALFGRSSLRITVPTLCILLVLVLVSVRGLVIEWMMRRVVPSSRRTAKDSPWHIISATDLASGEQVHFMEPYARVYSPTCVRGLGAAVGTSEDISLSRIVRSSCSVPAILPPVRFKSLAMNDCVLVDGGVSNNLATSWYEEVVGSTDWVLYPDIYPAPPDTTAPKLLLTVDGGGAFKRQPLSTPRRMPPLIQEVFVLFRSIAILYNYSVAPRVHDIGARLMLEDLRNRQPWRDAGGAAVDSLLGGVSGRTALVSLEVNVGGLAEGLRAQSPLREIEPELKRRADIAALIPFVVNKDWWNMEEDHLELKTTFGPLGESTVARLIWHGYLNALEASYLAFDAPLIEPPSLTEIGALLGIEIESSGRFRLAETLSWET